MSCEQSGRPDRRHLIYVRKTPINSPAAAISERARRIWQNVRRGIVFNGFRLRTSRRSERHWRCRRCDFGAQFQAKFPIGRRQEAEGRCQPWQAQRRRSPPNKAPSCPASLDGPQIVLSLTVIIAADLDEQALLLLSNSAQKLFQILSRVIGQGSSSRQAEEHK